MFGWGKLAPRHDHGRAVAGADIGESQYDVALAATEYAVFIPILAAKRAFIAARMGGVVSPGPADGRDTFVDEKTFNIGAGFAAVPADKIDPRRMVDKLLEGLPSLHTIVQLIACVVVIVTPLRVSYPFVPLYRGKPVKCFVQPLQQAFIDSVLQNKISVEIEKVVL